jgi:hypothetical protein
MAGHLPLEPLHEQVCKGEKQTQTLIASSNGVTSSCACLALIAGFLQHQEPLVAVEVATASQVAIQQWHLVLLLHHCHYLDLPAGPFHQPDV